MSNSFESMGLKGTPLRGGAHKRKYLVFSLSQKRYAIPLSAVKEVIGMCEITEIPKVPAFYKGLINLRGQIISVIDLRAKLNLKFSAQHTRETCILISHVGDILVGSIVDEVIEVVGYDESELEMSQNEHLEQSGDGVIGVAKDRTNEGKLTLILDIKNALDKTDFKVLKTQLAA
jgi:purine-binding chemotaxis protein CheW